MARTTLTHKQQAEQAITLSETFKIENKKLEEQLRTVASQIEKYKSENATLKSKIESLETKLVELERKGERSSLSATQETQMALLIAEKAKSIEAKFKEQINQLKELIQQEKMKNVELRKVIVQYNLCILGTGKALAIPNAQVTKLQGDSVFASKEAHNSYEQEETTIFSMFQAGIEGIFGGTVSCGGYDKVVEKEKEEEEGELHALQPMT